ncbi:ABC transporter substrate-binding protein [Paramicrobacterium chengjingii]|uniref:Sugar ABC transporter substrate-binding protein n=1 Tax=Paramicrobacterium chengjingii TaxID=2769067 RepID=A0ABX6YIX8_9MICO|nr:sugar ABC transporter substrate-binding protein [Microbacterium chengjingii]QPZ38297.1 sugar ABC transporter substrate-binding protein [Microbacterium chengjingii]
MSKIVRRVGAIAAATVIAATATACGSPGEGSSDSGGAINVVLSNHPWQRGLEPLISQFEEESGIKVNVQTFAEQQARDRILLNLQSKSSSMDVFMTLPSREGPQFSDAGYYQPLDDYLAEAPDSYKVDDFSPSAIDGMKDADGQVIAVPINIEGPVLYYRTDVFEELGLEVPETIEDVLAASKVIKEKGDITPITLRGAAAAIAFDFGPFFHGEGLEWTKEDGTANFDQPGAIKAIDEYATLARDFGPKGVINYSFTESSNLFAQGKVAMSLESSNELNSVFDEEKSTVSDSVGVAKMPAGSVEAAPTALSWGVTMSPFSEKKDAAWQFLQWATSPETQLELTKAEIAPPRDSVATDPSYVENFSSETEKQWLEAVADIQKNGNTEVGPVGTKAPSMRETLGNAIGKVILGDATAEEAAKEIQTELTKQLDKK